MGRPSKTQRVAKTCPGHDGPAAYRVEGAAVSGRAGGAAGYEVARLQLGNAGRALTGAGPLGNYWREPLAVCMLLAEKLNYCPAR